MLGLEEFLMQYDSPETRRAYKRDIKRFFDFSKIDAKDINRMEAIRYLDSLKSSKISNSSINRMISSMKSYCKFLIFSDVISKNPFEGMKLPKIHHREEDEITDDEVKKIIKKIKKPIEKAVIYLMLYNGLRRSEVCGLNYGDIDQRKVKQKNGKDVVVSSVRIRGKGDKIRIRPLHPLCMEAIIKYLSSEDRTKGKEDEPIFSIKTSKKTKRKSRRIYPEAIYRIVKSITKRARIKKNIHPHMFRAKFASLAIESGVPITTVQADLGHSSIETTAIYDHSKRSLERSSVYNIKEIK